MDRDMRWMQQSVRIALSICLLTQFVVYATADDSTVSNTPPKLTAFPGAEGYGAVTRGGRGGRVIAVTNLNESGPGSFREAIEAKEPRIVVFRVAGTIEGRFNIKNDFMALASHELSVEAGALLEPEKQRRGASGGRGRGHGGRLHGRTEGAS